MVSPPGVFSYWVANMLFKKSDKLTPEQRGLRYIVGAVSLVLLWKYREHVAWFIELPLFLAFDQEPPQKNIAGALLVVAEAIVFYTGSVVITLFTGLHKFVGYAGDGLWQWVDRKVDDGDPEVETKSEKIVDAINRIGAYVNDLLDRVEDLEDDNETEWEEVGDE